MKKQTKQQRKDFLLKFSYVLERQIAEKKAELRDLRKRLKSLVLTGKENF